MKKQSKACFKLPKILELPGWHEDHHQPGTSLQPLVQAPFTVKTKKEFNLSPRYAKELKLPPIFYSTPRDKTYQKIEEHLLESKIYEIHFPESKSLDKSISAYKSSLSLSALSIVHDSDILKVIKSNDEQQNSSGLPLYKTIQAEILKENSKKSILNQKYQVKEGNKSIYNLRHLQNNDSPCSWQDISGFNPSKSPIDLQDTLKISEDGDYSQVIVSNHNNQMLKSFSSAAGQYIGPGSMNSIGSLNISEDSAESENRYPGSLKQFSNLSSSQNDGFKVDEGDNKGRKDYKDLFYNQSGEFMFGKKDSEDKGKYGKKKEMKKIKDEVKGEDKKKEDVRGREGIRKVDKKREDKKIDGEKNEKGNKGVKNEDKSLKGKVNNESDTQNNKKKGLNIKSIDKTKDANDKKTLKNAVEEKKLLKLNPESKKERKYKEDNKESKLLKEVEDEKKDKNKKISKDVEEKKEKNQDDKSGKIIEKNQDDKSSKSIEKNKKLQEDKEVEKTKINTKYQQEELKNLKNKPTHIEKPKKILHQEQIEKSDSDNLDTAETPQKKIPIKSLKTKSQSLENKKYPKVSEKNQTKDPKESTKNSKSINKEKIKKKSSKSPEKKVPSSGDNQESSENDDIQEIIEEISSEDMDEISEISFELEKSPENSPQLNSSPKTQPPKILNKSQISTSKTPNLMIKTEEALLSSINPENPLSNLNTLPKKQITISKSPLQSTKPKRIKSKKSPKQVSKTKKKKQLKKVQLYNVEGQDVVISIINEDRKSPEFPQTDENSLSLLSPTSETPKASLLSTQGTLESQGQPSINDQNLLDFKRNSSKVLNSSSRRLKRDPIKSFISNFSIALLETINQIAKKRPKKIIKPPIDTSKSLNQSYNHTTSPTFQHKKLEKALNALKIDNDYEDEGQDSVNDLPQDSTQKLHTSYSLLIPKTKPDPQSSPLTQRPTLISSPSKLSDKYKNVSKFYSKKTEYEKTPSLLSKFSTIQKSPTNGILKNVHSDSSDSDDLSSSLNSESESIDYQKSDYLKNSALYEVENFELIKNLANIIYGANIFDKSGNSSKVPSSRSSFLVLSEEVSKVLKDCEEEKREEEEKIEECFEKEVDKNELNIVFDQNKERYLFFKQDSIVFKVPKMEFNTERIIMENGLDFDNKRRIELKNEFLTRRPCLSDLEDSEEYTYIKIIPAEENIADKLKFDKKSIQKALQQKKSHPKQLRYNLIK
ncbi:hypothetical protein SteCoe_26208 [Stentor coeruleus]|uniref:Uncharacterized protein n=1 Tax=Stentor coeruleus TaxID=5963 RepID=A0A1R2BDI0_9CILI|nr:hypothetical protein SteCoe_26208 [Stentor coeruleus]